MYEVFCLKVVIGEETPIRDSRGFLDKQNGEIYRAFTPSEVTPDAKFRTPYLDEYFSAALNWLAKNEWEILWVVFNPVESQPPRKTAYTIITKKKNTSISPSHVE